MGTNVTNITPTEARFNLSSAGITDTSVDDGIPDILISQTAQPANTNDVLSFVDIDGDIVGNVVTLNITQEPVVGNWTVDFYEFDSTQDENNFINTERPIHFFAVDFVDFGITSGNRADAVALIYEPNGNSDPSFIAYNSPSLGVAAQLSVLPATVPSNQNCDGTLTPSSIQVQLEDQNGLGVGQAGITVTASLESGPGSLVGTLTQITNGAGVATFDDLEFTVGGNHIIRFDFGGLDAGFTSVIGDATGCDVIEWDGSESTDWSNPANWTNNVVPDGNNEVIIPNGMPNYPVLDVDAGAGNLTMGNTTSVILNGFLFTLNGTLTNVATGASIDASAAGSELYISSSDAANIPAGLVEPDVANFTIENTTGATVNSEMNISEVLNVIEGNLTTNDQITMVCSFTPTRKTAQINELGGELIGSLTVEQCFPARRAFRLISPSTTTATTIHDNWQEGATNWDENPSPDPNTSDPNTSGYGTHITGVNPVSNQNSGAETPNSSNSGLDWQPSGNASMYSFNTVSQNWDEVLSTNNVANTLTAGEAYRLMIRGDRSVDIRFNASAPTNTKLRSSGNIFKGPMPLALSINQDEVALVGNPFHSNVDMRSVLNASTNLSQLFAVWDPTLGGAPTVGQSGGRGAYVTVNATNNTSNNSSSEMKRFVQPYQAFFVYANGNNPSITFNESDKAVTENQVDVFSTTSESYIDILLYDEFSYNSNSTPDDGLIVYFSPSDSNDVNGQDAPKFENIDENLARIADNQLLSYENRAMPIHDEELKLFTNRYRSSAYVFKVELGNFPDKIVYLKDSHTNEMHMLDEGENLISFSVDNNIPASLVNERFSILFESTTLSDISFEKSNIKVYPNPSSELIYITNQDNTDQIKNLTLFDISAREVLQIKVEEMSTETQLNVGSLSRGMYLLQIETQNNKYTKKIIVK